MFSVVIPVYNHERFLKKAVESALSSDLVSEVLLCDDGSMDGSDQLCRLLQEEHPCKVRNYSEQPTRNRGAHNRLNQLCRLATQPWIRVLNSDDYFLPGSFETLRLLALTERADIISGSMLICDDQGRMLGTKKGVFDPEYPLPKPPAPSSLLRNSDVRQLLLNQNFMATTTNMAFTRELFDNACGFSDFRYAHDLDFALRATMLGNSIWTAAFLATYRIHGSNTISEVSPHMDGEITRLYANFLDDFPEVEHAPEAREFLQGNRHIAPFPPSPKKEILRASGGRTSGLFLSPRLPNSCLPNVLLALGAIDYDFVVVSRSLAAPPSAVIPILENSVGVVGKAAQLNKTSIPLSDRSRGRVLRCPPQEKPDRASALSETFGSSAFIEGQDIHLGERREAKWQLRSDVLDELRRVIRGDDSKDRPVVFVLPIFLAVGGVERNTIEVIRNLKDRYHFVVITTEYLSERHGSLHWQLEDMGVPVFDLAEIAGQDHHLGLLSVLVGLLPPDLLWICNGSPWLVENAVGIRRLFANVPIVDQEVYDTEEGWIAHYDKKGIQSFDHFIAINSKIRTKFIQAIKIPAHRVSLIYPALNEEPVLAARSLLPSRSDARRRFGIPAAFDKLFIFVGRLTDQKRPLSFLELVRTALKSHPTAYFIMIGDGETAKDCDEFIKSSCLTNIQRIPYHPRPPEIMALANGMVITSIYEGLPIAMLEALAVGIPVLATDVGDIRLVLEEYGSGLVSDAIDHQGKATMPPKLWEDFIDKLPTLTVAAESSAAKVTERFNTHTISSQYNKLFQSNILSSDLSSVAPAPSQGTRP
jgi:glycosyltransferase involved in cell wall biosynthesis/GT2 family glycosyltransferase